MNEEIDTTMIDHIQVTVTIGEQTFTGWDGLIGTRMVAVTLPEVLYGVDLGDVEATVAERRTLATVLVMSAGESLTTFIKNTDLGTINRAVENFPEETPATCTVLLEADGHVLYRRVWLSWNAGDGNVGMATPQTTTMTPEFIEMIYPEYEWADQLHQSLSYQSRLEVVSATMAWIVLARAIGAGDHVIHDGVTLADDPLLGVSNPAWQGVLDSLPVVTDLFSDDVFDEIEAFANGETE